MGGDVTNLTPEPPYGFNYRILVVEEEKVAGGLWPVEPANASNQFGTGGQPLAIKR
jgi:hypothetical protein